MIVNAVLVHSRKHVEKFPIKVTDENAQIVLDKLLEEKKKIIDILKDYKRQGLIKSIWIPKNRSMKAHLDELVQMKREIKISVDKIKILT